MPYPVAAEEAEKLAKFSPAALIELISVFMFETWSTSLSNSRTVFRPDDKSRYNRNTLRVICPKLV